VRRPPRTIEYICLSCGAQGLAQVDGDDAETKNERGGLTLRCPKCGKCALCLERETASQVFAEV